MKNFIINTFRFIIGAALFLWFLVVYISYVCQPLSNGSDVRFTIIFICGIVFIYFLLRINERYEFLQKIISNKKIAIGILAAVLLASSYQLLFRYKYRTYKDGVGRVQIIRVDRLTGKSIFYYPEYQVLKEK